VTGEPWVPFGLSDTEASSYRVLVGGVPPWMRPSLASWLLDYFAVGDTLTSTSRLQTAVRSVRVNLRGDTTSEWTRSRATAEDLSKLTDDEMLRLTDWVLSVSGGGSLKANHLGDVLTQAGSKWQVGMRGAHAGLVERVPAGVQQAAEAQIAQPGAAGGLLAEAWGKVHGLQADDSGAYAAAVKAVEAASFEALGIANPEATLGNSIRTVEQDETYRLPFQREHNQYPTRDVLLGMLRTLWRGHRDRHGSADYSGVTHEEAEAAVLMAVTLVGWFSAGAVRKRSTEDYA
jgi:hypothetical protein